MVSSRKHFELKGKCVIEKLMIEAPGRMAVEFHNEACYIFLREGSLVINSAMTRTSMIPRDGVALNCGNYFADFFNKGKQGKSEVFAIHLYPDVLNEIFRNEIPSFLRADSANAFPAKIVSNAVMDQFIQSLSFYFDNAEIVTDEILLLKIKELVLLLLQSNHSASVNELLSGLFTRRSVSVSQVVNAHLYDNLSVEELAKLCALSTTSFKLEFTKIFKEPPARYIRKQKIERAKELLGVSNYSISEIADQVGYTDLSHFSKAFQALCGQSPTAFRNQVKLR